MNPDVAGRVVVLAAKVLGVASLLAFALFLLAGPVRLVELGTGLTGALVVDAALSLLFFVQHSGMVRRSFRTRLEHWLPLPYHGAVYTIASAVALILLLVLWQPTGDVLVSVGPPWRWLLRGLFVVAVAAFVWGLDSLGSFDGLGVRPLKAHLRGRTLREPRLEIRGPYRFVRHPLYTAVLVMIWSNPELTADRLLFNLLWTAWVVVAARLEERDLVADFGDAYRNYQRRVPMLLPAPWRRSETEST
ncbi:MAG TPA: isoprenylcysteine carboxylmethyltransferase family protein [Candidatus Sulfomarinibacteraceae bacterium]|nr:isoprenylcysteine carboxylmethyltransferase family protein [Candidatus Sulfomarinibacteraceae bacterium]